MLFYESEVELKKKKRLHRNSHYADLPRIWKATPTEYVDLFKKKQQNIHKNSILMNNLLPQKC